jgi:hypothetical protein
MDRLPLDPFCHLSETGVTAVTCNRASPTHREDHEAGEHAGLRGDAAGGDGGDLAAVGEGDAEARRGLLQAVLAR